MNVAVFGAGYVGLVTASCLADVGHSVTCVDIDAERLVALRAGRLPIYEPGLAELVARNHGAGRLKFTGNAAEALDGARLAFIAVGTPPNEDGAADLSHVLAAARTIGTHMHASLVVVDKSTVPVGTAERVAKTIAGVLAERQAGIGFEVCANPEFLKEGSAIEDFTRASRIIVGTQSEAVREAMRECYAPYNRNHDKLMFMGVREAELTKYAANAMLAAKISFMNEMANIAERLGVDIEQVRHGIGSDPRIGYSFIYPGAGYGGSCFPKDIRALIRMAGPRPEQSALLRAVEAVNGRQQRTLFDKLSNALDGDLAGRTIAIWGLAFKPGTDDMREAPSRPLMEAIWAAGGRVQAFDPEASGEARRLYGARETLRLCADPSAAVEGADALVICTEWKQFRVVDFAWLKQQLRFPVVVDGRNLWEPDDVRAAGLLYFAVGRGDSLAAPAAG